MFDRSHYEDVLVVRVHELVPRDVGKPATTRSTPSRRNSSTPAPPWSSAPCSSPSTSRSAKLAERLDQPDKYWKYNPGDLDERKLWPAYQEAYQAVLDRTSTEHAPWYVIPCDKKWYSRLAITELLIEALRG